MAAKFLPFSYFIGFLPTIIIALILAIIYFLWLFRSRSRIYKDIYGRQFTPEFWDVMVPIIHLNLIFAIIIIIILWLILAGIYENQEFVNSKN